MARLPIIIAPDPRLKVKSEPVATVDDGLRAFMDEMLQSMYEAPGIGLSAIQVGVAKRMIVVDVSPEDGPRCPLYLVNPEIVSYSDEGSIYNEGCLSLPDHFVEIERPERIVVNFVDYGGEPQTLAADGLLSRCIQHEVDHLEGILFVDHLSAVNRNMILRKLVKARRQQAADV